MKKINYVAALAALMISVSFISCSNKDLAEPYEVNTKRTATIEGSIVIRENLVPNDGKTYYAAPQLTPSDFIVTIDYSSLSGVPSPGNYIVPTNNVTYDKVTGKFSIVAPVSSMGSAVVITVSDISGKQTTQGSVKDGTWKGFNKPAIFVLPGQKYTQTFWEMNFVKETIGGNES